MLFPFIIPVERILLISGIKCPKGMGSWEFFDFLLEKGQVVGTPGAGFGDAGEGFFRLTAFSTKEKTKEAMERIKKLLEV